jgi:CheY-like chemotaxis protein
MSIVDLKAFVIDDQRPMRSIIRTFLYQIGIKKVEEADDGKTALEKLKKDDVQPDFILCDLHMEKMNGTQFIKLLRNDEQYKTKRVPVILVTGEDDRVLLEESCDAGAVAVLPKPCSLKGTAHAIGEAIGFILEYNGAI